VHADLNQVLQDIRAAVVEGRYVMTSHAYDEMEIDNLIVPDVESALPS
jgi:hypothetical protein